MSRNVNIFPCNPKYKLQQNANISRKNWILINPDQPRIGAGTPNLDFDESKILTLSISYSENIQFALTHYLVTVHLHFYIDIKENLYCKSR